MKRAVIMADGALITAEDLELSAATSRRNLNLRDHIHDLEGSLLRQAHAAADGNVSQVAKLMGISRPQVYHLMSEHKVRVKQDLEESP